MFDKVLLKIISVTVCLLCTAVVLESSERNTKGNSLSWLHADVTNLEKKIHAMINKERAKKGLPVLLWDESLHRVAQNIVRIWCNRENILTPYFKRQGIGVALSEDGKVYVTETFC